jgi:TPR repeat protein
LTIAAAAIAALYVVGKLPPWSVVAKDDSAETTPFDTRFAGATVATVPANGEALYGEVLRAATHPVKGDMAKPANPAPRLDAEEIAVLLKRGQELVAIGDLASARVVLRRAAEAHDARAALALAGTYDPLVLEKLAVYGLRADISLARSWYETAKEFGSAEAPRRLEMLAGRER